jgi:sugar O-acyltransferase (sialic acid O-acetyltransferase NeuD family)
MNKLNFVFWGAAGHAKVLADILSLQGGKLIALFDNSHEISSPWPDIPLYFGEEGFFSWRKKVVSPPYTIQAAIAIGGARGKDRCQIAEFFSLEDISLPPMIHPKSNLSESAFISEGCHILAGSTVCADTKLDRCVILNTNSSVDHECHLSEGVHIAPGATLCGLINVGAYTMIGPGSVIVPRVNIGSNTIIGAGSVVTSDIGDNVIAWGSPAKIMKENIS